MVKRHFWLKRIEESWNRRSIVWLSGVRRVGKTVLCESIPDTQYYDCEQASVRREMEDSETFLKSVDGKRVVLDEVHRLPNPSELLKIAADHFPKTKIVATGSSSLHAFLKFKDTLTGRKTEVRLTPMIHADLEEFGQTDLKHRLLRGGLPPFFLSQDYPKGEFQEWMDSYWAKDIQELFRVEKRASFQKFLELVISGSGGIFEASHYAGPSDISRPTVANYLAVLEDTRVAHVIRPYSTYKPTEIVSAPKVYAFDTGFVCHYRGWHTLRGEDLGYLWEHYILNEIHAQAPLIKVHYWRDKRGHEIDFVLVPWGKSPITVECKWSANNMETRNLIAFRKAYSEGENWLVLPNVERPFKRHHDRLEWDCIGLPEFIRRLEKLS